MNIEYYYAGVNRNIHYILIQRQQQCVDSTESVRSPDIVQYNTPADVNATAVDSVLR